MKRPRAIVSTIVTAVLVGAAAATAGASPALARATTGSLSGIVLDTRGAVVDDAVIVVYPSDLSGPEAARTTVGTTGRFRVADLPPGGYRILIGRHAWFEWAPGRITDPAKAGVYRVLAGRDTATVSVVTAAGVVAGRVTGPQGGPAAAIAVTVDDMSTASEWSATTSADGRYSVKVTPGTEYLVSFTNGELTQHSPRTLDWAMARHYTVRSGLTTRVDERLLPPAVLVGRFTDPSGTPIAGASVYVQLVATAGEVVTTTGADGRYRLDKLPPGDVTVGFTTPDGHRQWAYQRASGDEADLITLALGTVTTVDAVLLPLVRPAG